MRSLGASTSALGHDPRRPPLDRVRLDAAVALTHPIVMGIRSRISRAVSTDELRAYALDGAVWAVQTFDEARGVTFRGWVKVTVHRAILDGVRRDGRIPRRIYRRLREIDASRWAQEVDAAMGRQGEPPCDAGESADRELGSCLEAMADALAKGTIHGSDEELTLVPDAAPSPEEIVAREQLRAIVRKVLAKRPSDERKLLRQYYFHGKTLEQAAGGVSRSWASRVHKRALSEMARALLIANRRPGRQRAGAKEPRGRKAGASPVR